VQVHPEAFIAPILAIPPNPALAASLALKAYKASPPKTSIFTRQNPLRIQPLLTPDNYAAYVTKVIRSAKQTVYFQNQYIKVSKRPSADFERAVLDKQGDGIDVKIILRSEGDVRSMLEALRNKGFPEQNIRLQSGCHNKGIIVDSKIAVVGSHNWSAQGVTRNRDASLIFHNEEIARYFEAIFLYDWDTLAYQRAATETAMPVVGGTAAAATYMPWLEYYED
jgi:hypothetical protein